MRVPSDWHVTFFSGLAMDMWSAGFGAEESALDVDFLVEEFGLAPGAHVLDAACGNGRHLREFAACGIRATGIDVAAGFVEPLAREFARSPLVTVVHGDLRDAPLGGPYDAALWWGNGFGYLARSEDAAVLRRIGAALRPGARFALQTALVAEAALPNFAERHWERAGGIELLMDCAYVSAESRIDATYTYRTAERSETRKLSLFVYTLAEIGALLGAAGMHVGAVLGSIDGTAFELGDREAILIAEKIR